MGYGCGAAVTGDTLDELITATKRHAIELHGYTEEEVSSGDQIEKWKGAIKQTSRPADSRTPRPEDDRDIIPH